MIYHVQKLVRWSKEFYLDSVLFLSNATQCAFILLLVASMYCSAKRKVTKSILDGSNAVFSWFSILWIHPDIEHGL